jgi:hypothetical protein
VNGSPDDPRIEERNKLGLALAIRYYQKSGPDFPRPDLIRRAVYAKRFSKRKRLRAIARTSGLLGAHGGWWSWRRRHHQLVF